MPLLQAFQGEEEKEKFLPDMIYIPGVFFGMVGESVKIKMKAKWFEERCSML